MSKSSSMATTIALAEAIANKKKLDKETVLDAIENALTALANKHIAETGAQKIVRVHLDRKTGDYQAFCNWMVIPDEEQALPGQLTLSEAQHNHPAAQPGDVITEEVPFTRARRDITEFNRLLAQKLQEAEQHKIIERYRDRVGHLISGIVKEIIPLGVVLEIEGDKVEALLPHKERLYKDRITPGESLRAYLYEVKLLRNKSGIRPIPSLLVSRTHPEMLESLFKITVPEINEDLIKIKGIARDPGFCAKMAVKAQDGQISDPLGACIGIKGKRVESISNELGGERIDIVLWDDDPEQFVKNAMAPAEVYPVVIDEDSRTMEVAVALEEDRRKAIGHNRQNVRLASRLTGWNIKVLTLEEANEKRVGHAKDLQQMFINPPGIELGIAQILVREGFIDLETIVRAPKADLLAIEEFDQQLVDALQEQAKYSLLLSTLSTPSTSTGKQQDLDTLPGMHPILLSALISQGISTREQLAELAVDELSDMLPSLNQETVRNLIKAARQPWHTESGTQYE